MAESSRSPSGTGDLSRRLEDLNIGLGYNSAATDLVSEFYVPCLDIANRYDRAVGFFRSTVYHLVGVALSDFALRGGKMRLVCSPSLTPQDRLVLHHASRQTAVDASGSLEGELQELSRHPENEAVLALLAAFLRHAVLEVRIAYRPEEAGIFHEKLGIFRSPYDTVTFTGSANETYLAWAPSGNHEGIEAFGSWDPSDDRRVRRHIEYFESLWDSRVRGLRVQPVSELALGFLEERAEILSVEDAVERARSALGRLGRTRQPPRTPLQNHQLAAAEFWKREQRGIIDHVTGAGKTLTALAIVRWWLKRDQSRCCVIVVPTALLVSQWLQQVSRELVDLGAQLTTAGGTEPAADWREAVPIYTSRMPVGPRVLIATMQTASSPDFVARVQSGPHLLMIADEVHRIGSAGHRQLLSIDAGGRLGLSATPERFGDIEGTALIADYFGAVVPPPFRMADAISAGRLVPYNYYVHLVDLTEDEGAAYDALSGQIAAMTAVLDRTKSADLDARLALLRIQRARIIKTARNKPHAATSRLLEERNDTDRWLVYCEDSAQLAEVGRLLREGGETPLEYHSNMVADPPATLRYFDRHGGVLLAIRCLDEGVDIPSVDRAFILASSTNPRQYIQRRGRVLRTAPDKYEAIIHDLLVRRGDGSGTVVDRDLSRARDFAGLAVNASVRYELDRLSLAQDVDASFEDDDEEDAAW
jgi:superfamily II DNA or RNA helicase